MTQREFSNGLRILINIDAGEFPGPLTDWEEFRRNPWRYFITCPSYIQDKLWAVIESRQPKSRQTKPEPEEEEVKPSPPEDNRSRRRK